MRRCPIGIVVLFTLACYGCGVSKDLGGDLNLLTQYGNVQPQKIQFEGITWGIFDKPDEERMIVVSLGAYWPGAARAKQTEGAAHEYLERSKRDCAILSQTLASHTDWSFEFYYSCKK